MTTKPVALITGVTGQDGAYVAELLLNKGYEVHDIKRRASLFDTDRIGHLYQDPHVEHQRFTLHHGDLTDSTNLIRIIQQVQPCKISNQTTMSHVASCLDPADVVAACAAMDSYDQRPKVRCHRWHDPARNGITQDWPRGEHRKQLRVHVNNAGH